MQSVHLSFFCSQKRKLKQNYLTAVKRGQESNRCLWTFCDTSLESPKLEYLMSHLKAHQNFQAGMDLAKRGKALMQQKGNICLFFFFLLILYCTFVCAKTYRFWPLGGSKQHLQHFTVANYSTETVNDNHLQSYSPFTLCTHTNFQATECTNFCLPIQPKWLKIAQQWWHP